MPCYTRIEIEVMEDQKAMQAAAAEIGVRLDGKEGALKFKTYDNALAQRFKMISVVHKVMMDSKAKGYTVVRKTQGDKIVIVARRYSPAHASVKVEIASDATYKVFAEGIEGAKAGDLTKALRENGVIIEQHVGHHPHHHGSEQHDHIHEGGQ